MKINRQYIYPPVDIITTTLGIPEDYKQHCIQEAYKIGDKQDHKTNVKAIMSSYGLWEETTTYNPLLNRICNIVLDTIPSNDPRVEFELTTTWFAIYKEGHHTVPHSHLPSHLSFIYYLKANSTSAPLIFENCDFNITPYDDLLVIFPSHVLHSVPRHKGEDRICVAGNFDLVYTENKNKRQTV
mgnify:CR=1 FL=1